MFYSNEINLTSKTNKTDIINEMRNNNVYNEIVITEFMVNKKRINKENTKVSKQYTVHKYGKDVTFTVSLNSSIKDNFSVRSGTAIRANKKKGIPSIKYTDLVTEEIKDELLHLHKEKILNESADKLIEGRNAGYTPEQKRLLNKYNLTIEFEKLHNDDKKNWLIRNGFTGIENYDIYNSRPDGFGHTTGKCTMIDFDTKDITVIGFSSDD